MMLLQAACGTQVTVEADGADEVEAMQAIASLIDNKFGEDE